MMDFAAYEEATRQWIQTQLPGIDAQMRHEGGGWHGKPRALFHFMSSVGVGVDELRYELNADLETGTDYVPVVSGNRRVVLSVMMQTRDQTPEQQAQYYLEKLRTSLRKPSVQALFRVAGLAFATVAGVVNQDRWLDDRMESQAVMDLTFNTIAIDRDSEEADSYVAEVDVTGEHDETITWNEVMP
jgi:hypothetical protein